MSGLLQLLTRILPPKLHKVTEDLYRLNVVEISLPPLRDRPEDIPLLSEFFLQRLARKQGMARMRLSGESRHCRSIMARQRRELENTIARACAASTTDLHLPEDIPFARSPFTQTQKLHSAIDNLLSATPGSNEGLLHLISEICRKAFDESGGNTKESARHLGISQSELRSTLETERNLRPALIQRDYY